jgi:hypothetical protein
MQAAEIIHVIAYPADAGTVMQSIAAVVYDAILIPVDAKNKGRKKNCRPLLFLHSF